MLKYILHTYSLHYIRRGVVPVGAGGAMAPPDFSRSVNPISTRGGRLCPPNNAGTPGFSDLPTALTMSILISDRLFVAKENHFVLFLRFVKKMFLKSVPYRF